MGATQSSYNLDPIIISRCDRLGDLILSLPAVAHVRKNTNRPVFLHVSDYAASIGELARFNGVCDGYFSSNEGLRHILGLREKEETSLRWGLSLFHCKEAARLFKDFQISNSMGPRSKLSALLLYKWSMAQHRSRVEKSEMLYNVDLAEAFMDKMSSHGMVNADRGPFVGLPPLKLPESWFAETVANALDQKDQLKKPDVLIVASNGNSAANWPMPRYIEEATSLLDQGLRVDILLHGHDASQRYAELKLSSISDHPKLRAIEKFENLKQLILHISRAKKVISSSTGPLHIAHAMGIPVVGIYPRAPKVQSFERWRPHGYWHDAPVEWVHI